MRTKNPHPIPRDEDLEMEDFSIDEFFRLDGQRYIVFEKDPYQIAHCIVYTGNRLGYLEYMLDERVEDLGYNECVYELVSTLNRLSLDYLADGIILFERFTRGEADGYLVR